MSYIPNSVVLMTALLPTTGHEDLIRFASNVTDGEVYVILSSRSNEPILGADRVAALKSYVKANTLLNVNIISHTDDSAPQNPNPELETVPGADIDFWDYWSNTIIRSTTDISQDTAIISSEPYGLTVANHMNCRFIPYDIDRSLNPAKGTDVRHNINENWLKINQSIRADLSGRFIIFGQESVGKTTMAKALAKSCDNAIFIPEYARSYLETVGPEITAEKMDVISHGQNGYFEATFDRVEHQRYIFDTDLLSTIGYYRILGWDEKKNSSLLTHDRINQSFIDKYYLMPDDIPFEEDALRYGGNVRQSSYEFWKDLLEEFKRTYVEVPRGLSFEEKRDFIQKDIDNHMDEIYKPIIDFVRD